MTSFETEMMSPALQHTWRGRMVARILPLGLEPNYAQQGKRLDRQVDPSPFLNASESSRRSAPKAISEEEDFSGRCAEIVVSLHHKHQDSIVIHMQRAADEPFASTMKRLRLTINKRLTKKQLKDSKQIQAPVRPEATEESNLPSLWTIDPGTGSLNEQQTFPLDRPSASILREAASSGLVLALHDTATVTEPLSVDYCPPTVSKASTFADFKGCIFPGIPIHVKVEALFASTVVVDWYAGMEKVRHNSLIYVPTEKDVDKFLTIVIRPSRNDHSGEGCEEAYQFLRAVQLAPLNEIVQMRPAFARKRDANNCSSLRVITYNILADQNCAPSFYPHCSKEFLQKERRMPMILQEVQAYQGDIICLQEVDEHVYYKLFVPVLHERGYDSQFACKTTPGKKEGCALFWNAKRLVSMGCQNYVMRDQLPFDKPASDAEPSTKAIHELLVHRPDLREVLKTHLGHVFQIATLRDLTTGEKVTVANTHLFYHPYASHIRTLQVWCMCQPLFERLTHCERKDPPHAIICGDLNSHLDNSCGKLLLDRRVAMNHRHQQRDLNGFQWERQDYSTIDTDPTPDDFPTLRLPESLPKFRSSWIGEQPEFTHRMDGFMGNVDHILITEHGFCPILNSPMPTTEQLADIPNARVPSDHLSIVCDLQHIRRL